MTLDELKTINILNFKALPGPFKWTQEEPNSNVIVRRVILESKPLIEWLRAFNKEAHDNVFGGLYWKRTFIVNMPASGVLNPELEIHVGTPAYPIANGNDTFIIGTDGVTVKIRPFAAKKAGPIEYLLSLPAVDNAIAMTFPDEKGRSVVFSHVGSELTRKRWPKLYKKTAFNVGAIKGAKDWKILSNYIEKNYPKDIDQQTVCDIVREISMNLAVNDVTKLTTAAGEW